MIASPVNPAAQAPTSLPAPVQPLFLTQFSERHELEHSGNLDPDQLQLRATTVTQLLKKMMDENHPYRDYGIND